MLVRLGLSLIYLWQVVAVLGHRKQPNMIFILLDDLGWGDVSWHTPGLPTSNMERLAREGLTLEQAYSQQVCTPSRYYRIYYYITNNYNTIQYSSRNTKKIPLTLSWWSLVSGHLPTSLRLVRKTKIVSYHLREVVVPIKCLGIYRVATKMFNKTKSKTCSRHSWRYF